LSNKAFHARVCLVDVDRGRGLDIFRVVDLVHEVVSVRFHVLYDARRVSLSPVPFAGGRGCTHINLFGRPGIHRQGLDLGYVRAQLAVECGAPHAKENAHLKIRKEVSRRDRR
jgi:hypothetical protein